MSAAAQAIIALIEVVTALVKAGDDKAAQEEALMRAAEIAKARLDDLKFGPRP